MTSIIHKIQRVLTGANYHIIQRAEKTSAVTQSRQKYDTTIIIYLQMKPDEVTKENEKIYLETS